MDLLTHNNDEMGNDIDSSSGDEEPEIVSRAEWQARPPLRVRRFRDLPTNAVYSETETKSCTTKAECVQLIQEIQTYHMDVRGMPDIQYHFMIGGDGNVYEGRGWDHVGEINPNKDSRYPMKEVEGSIIEVAFIGTFAENPPKTMLKLASGLILLGINQYKLKASRRTDDTLTRGDLQEMKKTGTVHIEGFKGEIPQELKPYVDEDELQFDKDFRSP